MMRLSKIFGIILLIPTVTACHSPPSRQEQRHAGTASRISITAEAGSEVVLTKYGNSNPNLPMEDTDLPAALNDPEAAFSFLPQNGMETGQSVQRAGTQPASHLTNEVVPLGNLRIDPWHVRAGETLLDTLERFAKREGYTVRKSAPYPVWEITTSAKYIGSFKDSLDWLMQGFAHTDPRPVLALHSNRVIRLSSE